jgi:hypothetical protein
VVRPSGCGDVGLAGKSRAQGAHRTAVAGAGGADGDAKRVRHVHQRHVLQVVQHDDRAVVRRDLAEPVLEQGSVRDDPEVVRGHRRIGWREAAVGQPAWLPPSRPMALTHEDSCRPGLEPLRIAQAAHPSPHVQQCLLQGIFG